jgi:hypothetical protein
MAKQRPILTYPGLGAPRWRWRALWLGFIYMVAGALLLSLIFFLG